MNDELAADLAPNAANHLPLTPLDFLARSADVYANKVAVRYGEHQYTYQEFVRRCRRLASRLQQLGVRRGDTVAILAPNVPAMLEAHFAVPALGAILNALNYRLDAETIAFCLDHGRAKAILVDREFSRLVPPAEALQARGCVIIGIDDPDAITGEAVGTFEYEGLLEAGDPDFAWSGPLDEWDSLSLLYTSGTTGNPKGVVYHHRGAYLNALGNVIAFGLTPNTVYLWTLPMFHCNGWTYPWAVTAAGGTHVCLRRVEAPTVFAAIRDHRVTHLCASPVVLNMLIHASSTTGPRLDHRVDVATGGAAPPSSVIAAMEKMGFRVTHLYGLTEVYGPATLCAWQEEWAALSAVEKTQKMARQGVALPTMSQIMVADPATHQPVPLDGKTMGEVMFRGNTVMKGYLHNSAATEDAFREGWYHTGDLAVWHEDHYIEIKDRLKDIIISGGENISSLEVEECLYRHPNVMEAAVVARPDEKWGETPCAFVMLKPDAVETSESDIIQWCRDRLAHYKAPKAVVFGPLPKTSTGKIQKYILRKRASTLDRSDSDESGN